MAVGEQRADATRRRRGHDRGAGGTNRHARLGLALAAPAALYVVLMMLLPLGYNIATSLRDMNLGNLLSGDAAFVGLANYRNVLGDPAFWHAAWVSLAFTAGSLALQFGAGLALALFFNQRFPLAGLLRALLLVAWVLPPIVSGTLFRWMLDGDTGIVNAALASLGLGPHYWLADPRTALGGTILANTWIGVPFNLLLLLAGLRGIPVVLYEAAQVDGASAWRRFRYITVPLLRPMMTTVLILGLIYTFRAFDIIFVMTRGGPVDATTTLPIQAYQLNFEFFRLGDGAAALTLLLIVPLLLSLVYVWRLRREAA